MPFPHSLTMSTAAQPMPFAVQLSKQAGAFPHWLRTHRGAVAIAGLLAFAAPVTFFTGALSVMRAPTAFNVARLGVWWMLYGVSLWCALLVLGYCCERGARRFNRYVSAGAWLLAASAAAAFASVMTAGRTTILVEQGLVYSADTAHLYAFTLSLIMALLYFAHLRRSRGHEHAAARLAAAQTAQRHARRRIVQARLQEVQARVDPQLLFEMLDTVRHLYEGDAARAEHFLDELIVFLRAALPRLRTPSSSLLREVELASAFVRLHALAAASGLAIAVDISPDTMHARFPPGVLLPLLDTTVASGVDTCRLAATRSSDDCRLVLTLDGAPSNASVERVRSLLTELYGTAAKLEIEGTPNATHVIVQVPYELA
jgi:hypothetical protein